MYKDKIEKYTFLFKRVMSDNKEKLDKEKEKGKGKVVKGSFGPTFDEVEIIRTVLKKKPRPRGKKKGR